MKTALISCLCVMLMSAQAQTPNSAGGKVSNGIYTNDFFTMSYPLPQGFYEVPHQVNNHVGPATLLLVADRHTGTMIRERILITADKIASYNWDTKRYVDKFARATAAQTGVKLLEDITDTRFGSRHFCRANWTQDYSGTVLYKSFLSTDANGYFLSWTFAAASQSRLQELVRSMQGISFAAH